MYNCQRLISIFHILKDKLRNHKDIYFDDDVHASLILNAKKINLPEEIIDNMRRPSIIKNISSLKNRDELFLHINLDFKRIMYYGYDYSENGLTNEVEGFMNWDQVEIYICNHLQSVIVQICKKEQRSLRAA